MNILENITIDKPDEKMFRQAKENWDHISKPLDGLGDFEELICRISAIRGTPSPMVKKRAAVIFCADNGIVEEGISQSPKDITLSVAKALGEGISSACTLAGFAGVDIIPVDIGTDCDENIPGVRNMKVSKGTGNFLKGPALSKEAAIKAIESGITLVKELAAQGYEIIATGEMGIGNTTTSAAVLSALLKIDSDIVTGKGAGLSDAGLLRKKQVIKKGLEKYGLIYDADGNDYENDIEFKHKESDRAFYILQCLGGLDLAALAGAFIGGAICHIPMVIDGVISATAALIAEKLVPGTKDYLVASHAGREAGCLLALDELSLKPYLGGNMALGEGTGALMLFPLLDMVLNFYENAAKFSDYKIEEYKRF